MNTHRDCIVKYSLAIFNFAMNTREVALYCFNFKVKRYVKKHDADCAKIIPVTWRAKIW